jgi:tRNA A-37 threonylcarbamoyl transferase component Bud32
VKLIRELTKKEVKEIRKLLKNGIDVPEICLKFSIPPSEWRDVVNKNNLF